MLQRHRKPRRCASFALAALVLIMTSSAACQRDATTSAQTAGENPVAIRTVTVPVDGMICMVCAGSVKNALKAVHGVQNAEVNLEKHNAVIHYEDGQVILDQLTQAINELGYKAGVPAPSASQ
jgi:copper chaperone CopZ